MSTEPKTYHFNPSGNIPNHPKLPVLLYGNALQAEGKSLADLFEERFQKNGWRGTWRWGVYDFHHYHSNAHEVLGVASGRATITLGGPDGETVTVAAGDAMVLPAGTGHKCESSSSDFQVVGAYPADQENKDLVRADQPPDESILSRIRETALPENDPIKGADGPLLQKWK